MAGSDPGAYVIEITKQAIDTLTDQSITSKEKEIHFGELFDKNFDVPSIARFVLGKYWKKISTDKKKEFIKAFRDYVVKTYSTKFDEYSGEKLCQHGIETQYILEKFDSCDYVLVSTEISEPKYNFRRYLIRR